ncbi:MAG: FAD:protein FMN transferase [Halieaceae bacterium]
MIGAKAELRDTVLGRPCHIVVEDPDGKGQEHATAGLNELKRLASRFSSSHPDSLIGQLNALAGTGESLTLDPEARSLFKYVTAVWEQSRHMFDPSSKLISECYRGKSSAEGINGLLAGKLDLVGWSKLVIDENGARLPEHGMSIDLNSCIRPYALDRTCKLLKAQGAGRVKVDLDTDIATLGKQPDGANWLVGIRHPQGSRTAITRVKLNNRGYAIRGDYENPLMLGGERFGRALSPVDGRPVPGLLSVAVVANTALEACTAANIARLKPEPIAIKWLTTLELPWLAITRELECLGPLAPERD